VYTSLEWEERINSPNDGTQSSTLCLYHEYHARFTKKITKWWSCKIIRYLIISLSFSWKSEFQLVHSPSSTSFCYEVCRMTTLNAVKQLPIEDFNDYTEYMWYNLSFTSDMKRNRYKKHGVTASSIDSICLITFSKIWQSKYVFFQLVQRKISGSNWLLKTLDINVTLTSFYLVSI
jgi:hypothetical protein